MGKADTIKKKIIFVISRMSIGGAQKSLVNALCALDYDQYDVTLYVRENKTDLVTELPNKVKVTVNTNKRRYEHTPYTILLYLIIKIVCALGKDDFAKQLSSKSRKYIVKKKTDYERKHYSAVLKQKYDIAISYLQGYTCKFTYDCVNADRMICFYHNSTDALPELHKEYLKKFEKIVVVSVETKDFLSNRYRKVSDRIIVIKNLMDIERIKAKAQEVSVKKDSGIKYLCTCGRVSPEKGFDLAIKAAEILKTQGYHFKWFFVGDGPELYKIKKESEKLGLDDNMIFLGLQENPYPWISQSDIYVQSSYEEAQPLSIMEAQILGTPIVSTNTVGGNNIINNYETGLLCEINAESLSESISKLIDDNALCKRIREKTKKLDYRNYNQQIKKQWDELLTNTE